MVRRLAKQLGQHRIGGGEIPQFAMRFGQTDRDRVILRVGLGKAVQNARTFGKPTGQLQDLGLLAQHAAVVGPKRKRGIAVAFCSVKIACCQRRVDQAELRVELLRVAVEGDL